VLGARPDARGIRHALLRGSDGCGPDRFMGWGQRSGPWLFFGGSRVTDTTYTMKEPIKLWSPWRTAQQIMR
jgi:hypothetical protein